MRQGRRNGIVQFAIAALLVALAAPAAQAQMKGALLYAHCAGIADGMFSQALVSQDQTEMDYFSEQAHLFMVLAWRERGKIRPGALQQMRVEAPAHLFHEGATDDSIHAMVQECSDLHQQLVREGRFPDAR